MAYSIVQTALEAPTHEQLGAAFATLERFTKHDGQLAAKDAYGVLAEGLSKGDADALCAALTSQGVQTTVVEDAEFPALPHPQRVKRVALSDAALTVFDGLGRESAVPWETIRLIAVGLVVEEDFQRGADQLVLYDQGIFTMPGDHEQVHRMARYIDVVRDVEPRRYQIDGSEFRYDYLGDRQANDWRQNFATLVGDIVQRATTAGAALNRGAHDMIGPADNALAYPSRHGYEEEIQWLLWRGRMVEKQ